MESEPQHLRLLFEICKLNIVKCIFGGCPLLFGIRRIFFFFFFNSCIDTILFHVGVGEQFCSELVCFVSCFAVILRQSWNFRGTSNISGFSIFTAGLDQDPLPNLGVHNRVVKVCEYLWISGIKRQIWTLNMFKISCWQEKLFSTIKAVGEHLCDPLWPWTTPDKKKKHQQ